MKLLAVGRGKIKVKHCRRRQTGGDGRAERRMQDGQQCIPSPFSQNSTLAWSHRHHRHRRLTAPPYLQSESGSAARKSCQAEPLSPTAAMITAVPLSSTCHSAHLYCGAVGAVQEGGGRAERGWGVRWERGVASKQGHYCPQNAPTNQQSPPYQPHRGLEAHEVEKVDRVLGDTDAAHRGLRAHKTRGGRRQGKAVTGVGLQARAWG